MLISIIICNTDILKLFLILISIKSRIESILVRLAEKRSLVLLIGVKSV